MNELKPCPFCGGRAEILMDYKTYTATGSRRFFITCAVCMVETPRIARTKEQAANAWNRRATDE